MSEPENPSSIKATSKGDAGITVSVFGRTDVGLVREHNEDNFLVADLSKENRSIKPEVRDHIVGEKGTLFSVCDGMGGAAAGEVASQIAVDTIYEMMQKDSPPEDNEDLASRLDAAIIEAGLRIFTAAKLDRKRRGMGTTVTAAVMTGSRLIVGQVGDSRAYILRKGRFVQVTKDQSLVQQLLDAKQLTEEEARHFGRSNIILQALGTTEEVRVDITSAILKRGDMLVMCSDGLCGPVESDTIRDAIMEDDEPIEVCRKLTDLACEAGGHDNITVIVATFDGDSLSEPTEDDDLSYRKYYYSSSVEGVTRSSIPKILTKQGRERSDGKQTKSEGAAALAPEEAARKRTRSGLIAAVSAALLVGIALFAYTLLLDEMADNANGNDAVVPLNTEAPPVSGQTPSKKTKQKPDIPIAKPKKIITPKETSLAQEVEIAEKKTNEERPKEPPSPDTNMEASAAQKAAEDKPVPKTEKIIDTNLPKKVTKNKADKKPVKDKPVQEADKQEKKKKETALKEDIKDEETKPETKETIKPVQIEENPF